MSCECLDKLTKQLEPEGLDMQISYSIHGGHWPYMCATNEMRRAKGEKKRTVVICANTLPILR